MNACSGSGVRATVQATLIATAALLSPGALLAQLRRVPDVTVAGADRPGALRGVAWDSVASAPLGGAVVQLVPSDALGRGDQVRSVTADAAGRFLVPALPAGDWAVAFAHERLDALGVLLAPARVAIRPGDTTEVALAVPTAGTLRRQLCGDTSPSVPGLVMGWVRGASRDVPGDPPPSDASTRDHRPGDPDAPLVSASWVAITPATPGGALRIERRAATVPARAGSYVLCGPEPGLQVRLLAQAGPRASGVVITAMPDDGLLVRDITVAESGDAGTDGAEAPAMAGAAGGSARPPTTARDGRIAGRIAGRVHADDGRPLPDARIRLVPARRTEDADRDDGVRTDSLGHFALAGVPRGTRTLEVRAIGYAVAYVVVDVEGPEVTAATVTLTPLRLALDTVRVRARATTLDGIPGLAERRLHGGGVLLTPEELTLRNPAKVVDLLAGVPGAIVRQGEFGPLPGFRGVHGGTCNATVALDGRIIPWSDTNPIENVVNLVDVRAVEIYPRWMEAPLEFQRTFLRIDRPSDHPCGVILLWTGLRQDARTGAARW